MIPQYRIFYSWQSDNTQAKDLLQEALKTVKKQLKNGGIAVEIEQGGGGCGFISIEDSVRMKIRRCDIFVGDVTPVGNVAMKGKLLPNANVMYEMGVATECMYADRILAVAMKGDWKVENMPFDFNHYTMLHFDPSNGLSKLVEEIKKRIKETDKVSKRENNRFFSERVINKNISSEKYLPDTFLEDLTAKEKARAFVAPHKMYYLLYDQVTRLNFDHYNKQMKLKGSSRNFKLNVKNWDIHDKTIDIECLRQTISGLLAYLVNNFENLSKDGNEGRISARKIERLIEILKLMNKQVMVVTSDAGQGKTNFVCDMVRNVLKADGIPYVFTNAYELSSEQLAKSIASEYNFIGDFSLEEVLLKAEHYCHQHLQYIIIVIDGLNEHPQQGPFKNNLARVLDAIKEHTHVKALLTCRKQYYDNNYQIIQQTVGDGLYELKLNKRRWNDSETTEDQCLIERYASYFNVKGKINQNVRNELLDNLLLMRIFFQGYQGQDVSKIIRIDYVELYEQYYKQLCDQIQNVIEQDAHVSNVSGMTTRIFDKIIGWMVKNNVFANLPIESVVTDLTSEEQQCFTAFMSSNLLLKQDMPDGIAGVDEVLNFTYEQIRDYLVTRYLVDKIYPVNKTDFQDLVEQYTTKTNNQSEGTRMFLFLYSRHNDNHEVYQLLKSQSWYERIFFNYIWDVPDDKITDEDIKRVKAYMRGHADDVVKTLTYTHWSPVQYKQLNIQVLFGVLEEMNSIERNTYLETLWPSKPDNRYMIDEPVVTQRGELISSIRAGISRRNAQNDKERDALKQLEKYLTEGEEIKKLYVPRKKEQKRQSPYVIYGYDSYRYLMRVHKGEKNDFLRLAGANKGYAKEMFGSIYDAIFAEAKDVLEMYQNFYVNEYKDFEHFLTMHYSIPSTVVKKLAKVQEEKDYRLIDFDALSFGGDAVSELVMSDDYFIRMYNWLNWQNDENKD